MTANPVSVTQATHVLRLLNLLQNNRVFRVPVVDSKGKLIGIVTRRDLLRGYLQTSGS
ncbi:MAG: CBS domain-containing protein [Nitrospirales bacterium]|nr:CBS domain-containing protein [Nitrospirales bacterium]